MWISGINTIKIHQITKSFIQNFNKKLKKLNPTYTPPNSAKKKKRKLKSPKSDEKENKVPRCEDELNLEKIEIPNSDLKLSLKNWLSDSNIDLALLHFRILYPKCKIVITYDLLKAIRIDSIDFSFEEEDIVFIILANSNHWITVTNIDTNPEQSINCDQGNKQNLVYDSLNAPNGAF